MVGAGIGVKLFCSQDITRMRIINKRAAVQSSAGDACISPSPVPYSGDACLNEVPESNRYY